MSLTSVRRDTAPGMRCYTFGGTPGRRKKRSRSGNADRKGRRNYVVSFTENCALFGVFRAGGLFHRAVCRSGCLACSILIPRCRQWFATPEDSVIRFFSFGLPSQTLPAMLAIELTELPEAERERACAQKPSPPSAAMRGAGSTAPSRRQTFLIRRLVAFRFSRFPWPSKRQKEPPRHCPILDP
jgi:hypothetical protein